MKVFKACISFIILILLCSSCSITSSHPIDRSATPFVEGTNSSVVITPTPSDQTTALPNPSIEPLGTNSADNAGLFNEDNFTQYFQFGMSRRDAEKELDKLKISWSESMYKSDEGDAPPDLPEGFWDVTGDGFTLRFNAKNLLYYIDTKVFNTSNGLCIGDSPETMRQLYGQEDELNEDEYVYHKNGYYFAVDMNDDNRVWSWNVFIDIWNGPIDFKPSTTATLPGSDDPIQFNEYNFTDYFHFGMRESSVIKELNKLGVRIVIDYLGIETDHIWFGFDNDRLAYIQVRGWKTAKGLNTGDSGDKLYQLYGKENRFGDNSADEKEYIYDLKGYSLEVRVDNWYTHVYGVDCWLVSNNKNIINK